MGNVLKVRVVAALNLPVAATVLHINLYVYPASAFFLFVRVVRRT